MTTSNDEVKVLLDQIAHCRKLVDTDPVDFPVKTRAGFEIAARQAKDSLFGLERQYVELLAKQSVTVVTLGEPGFVAEFVKTAVAEGVQLTVDTDDLYRKIAHRVEPALGSDRLWGTSHHSLAVQFALSEGVDLGIKEMSYANDRPFQARVVPDLAAMTQLVHETVIDRLEYDLPRVYVRTKLRRDALDKGLVPDKAIGVLIQGASTHEEANELLQAWPTTSSTSAAVVIVDHKFTADEVRQVFRRVKKLAQPEAANEMEPAESTSKTQKKSKQTQLTQKDES